MTNRDRRTPQEWFAPLVVAFSVGMVVGGYGVRETAMYRLGEEAQEAMKECTRHYLYVKRVCQVTATEVIPVDPNDLIRKGGTYWGNNPNRGSYDD